MNPNAIIWTEGKTDLLHLKRAFLALSRNTNLSFKELTTTFGEDQLLKQCMAFALEAQPCPTIFIFDRDNIDIVNKVETTTQGYKEWGNNVYSFAIPKPTHRTNEEAISIEFYYTDEELRVKDRNGKRLFVSDEFNPQSGRHRTEPRLSLGNKGIISRTVRNGVRRIIDSEVYDDCDRNVALSKADFAQNVFKREGNFADFDFAAFRLIFDVIDKILHSSLRTTKLPFGSVETFIGTIQTLDYPQQFAEIVKASIRVCKLTAMTFIAATLRYYEQRIVNESGDDSKKVRPIKEVLAQSFGHPSLTTLQKLARYCFHVVDDDAPSAIWTLREMITASPRLGAIGELLDNLECIFGSPRVRIVNKQQLSKPILEYVFREFARYEGKIVDLLKSPSLERLEHIDPVKWHAAIDTLVQWFGSFSELSFRVREIERIGNDSEKFDVLLTTYQDNQISVVQTTQTYQDLKEDRFEAYELLLEPDELSISLDLFPFVLIKKHQLHYYNRTTPQGYQYNVVFGDDGHLEANTRKRKFSQLALRTTIAEDLQWLFWAQVTPTVSDLGVKANIPAHGEIVGREQQISLVMAEIIEIPNQNGIVYGPGGVGKTALLIELSRRLYEEMTPVLFKNLIWVSAKQDYYDPTLDDIKKREPQFLSLDNVLTNILAFHGFEDAHGYNLSDKKWLTLEALRDEKTLLILDNFESVARTGQDEILKFFGIEAKQVLKDRPDYFKVLITSRKLVPCGFHQIQLKGLDEPDSEKLMNRLYDPYIRSGKKQLTPEQMHALYDATQGIPLLVKHCYGQIYEYSSSLDRVLKKLSSAGNIVIDFSFAEIFALLKQDPLQLRIILLLELSAPRLMARQISDILGANEVEIADRLDQLVNYQCANMSSTGTEEKYGINDEVRSLTRRLTLEHAPLATEIKRQIASLSLDKRMDYSRKEFDAVMTFEDYISQGHYVLAENFINERLAEHKGSLLLNLHYAKYLKEIKGRTQEAIERLEAILPASKYDQQILRLLMAYYVALDIPNYEQAYTYARELEDVAAKSKEIKFELANFYIAWSTALKMKVELDPLKENVRRQKYRELADLAIRLLKEVSLQSHDWHYLLARGYYNRWDNESASRHISKAIELLPQDSYLIGLYRKLQNDIDWKRELDLTGREQQAESKQGRHTWR